MFVKLNFLVTVILTLSLRQVILRPSATNTPKSKVLNDIEDEYYDYVNLPRIKKAVVVNNKCPKGMSFYNGQCMTREEYELSKDEVYEDLTDDTSTQDNKRVNTVAVPADVSSKSDQDVLDVNKLSRNNTKSQVNTSITAPRSDNSVNRKPVARNELMATVIDSSSADKIYNNKTVASTTMPKVGSEASSTWRKTMSVFAFCTCAIILIWLLTILHRYLKHVHERGSYQLSPSSEITLTSFESFDVSTRQTTEKICGHHSRTSAVDF